MKPIRLLISLFLLGLIYPVWAADIPSDVMGSEKFDRLQCVAGYTQNCVNSHCLNSEERNCKGSCEKMAVHKCKQQTNE